MFALNRISASFQPAGSDSFIPLGEVFDVKITDTITIGGDTFTNTYEPGNPASMEAATNRSAEARRARRNAKRAREAAKVGG